MSDIEKVIEDLVKQVGEWSDLVMNNQQNIINNTNLIQQAITATANNMALLAELAKVVREMNSRLKKIEDFHTLQNKWGKN